MLQVLSSNLKSEDQNPLNTHQFVIFHLYLMNFYVYMLIKGFVISL